MAGLGDYTKGKKFTLKSGNKPAFKMMGTPESGDSPITSPANMNNFGVGKGTSPYMEVDWSKAPANNTQERIDWYKKNNLALDDTTKLEGAQGNQGESGEGGEGGGGNQGEGEDKGKGGRGKNWAKIGVAALTGGLDAVYGSGKIVPSGSARLIKKKKDDEETEDKNTAQSIIDGNTTGAGFSADLAPK